MSFSSLDVYTIPRQSGTSFVLRAGEQLKVIDSEGGQVSDLCCVAFDGRRESLSAGCTIDYNDTIYLTKGHVLYSTRGLAMLEITEDTVACHDILLAPCSSEMFQKFHSHPHHASCKTNLCTHLSPFDVPDDSIASTFNIFMNVKVMPNGRIEISPPISRAGDYIVLRAVRDLVVGLTACSDEQTNGGTLKPIAYQIIR